MRRNGKRWLARLLQKRAGFALLAVIWGTGIISLLVVSFMTTGRLRLQTAHNLASATQAGYIAEAVVNLSLLSLLSQRDAPATQPDNAVIHDGAPHYCVFDGAAVALEVEEEAGKIDLNAATPELLQTALIGLGVGTDAAAKIAKSIVSFRTPAADPLQPRPTESAGKPFGPKLGPFETALELDQVNGMGPALFRELIPYVTVHSHSPGVDARSSPPALFAALAGFPIADVRALRLAPYPNGLDRNDPRFPANLKQPGDRGAYKIHVEALLATGQTASKDAIVDMRPTSGLPFTIKEMRRGKSHYIALLREMIARNGAGVPDC